MKVLHAIPSLSDKSGGPVATTIDFCSRLRSLGVVSDILGFGDVDVPMPDCGLPRSSIHALPLPSLGPYGYSWQLTNWLRRRLSSYDGVVIHGMWQYLQFAVARECKRIRLPYVCFPHGMLDDWPLRGQGAIKSLKKQLYWHAVERFTFNSARAAFFTTPREMEHAKQLVKYTCPSTVVPYGLTVPLGSVDTDRADLRELGANRVALFLSRVHPKKNVELLLRAWATAAPPQEWILVIAGTGDPAYIAHLRNIATALKIAAQVRFVGHVRGDNKRFLFQMADWFLLPSHQENFGIAVLEALHHGCAVAISDQVYLADYFPGECPVLPLDGEVWKGFIESKLNDEAYRRSIIEVQNRDILPRFDMTSVCSRWVVLLEQVFARGTASGMPTVQN